jgi:hypothetical protein
VTVGKAGMTNSSLKMKSRGVRSSTGRGKCGKRHELGNRPFVQEEKEVSWGIKKEDLWHAENS